MVLDGDGLVLICVEELGTPSPKENRSLATCDAALTSSASRVAEWQTLGRWGGGRGEGGGGGASHAAIRVVSLSSCTADRWPILANARDTVQAGDGGEGKMRKWELGNGRWES